ncbi:MAG: nucleotidyl transferase AbiEii/AbiGii toxin family protein [Polyangiaceae bacterium]|nr:nucleotidyl transferase AbiEii/AbiGii toxin family protein [Polyangiaceae bacterium]
MSKLTRPTPKAGFPKAYFESDAHRNEFDPALKHYPHAYVQVRETAAKGAALDATLRGMAHARSRADVVVRGSVTLARWFGERARPPHDIDLVVRDASLAPDAPGAVALIDDLRAAACEGLVRGGFRPLDADVSLDGIWTYERAEGRRLSIPFLPRSGAHAALDAVQIDLVFRAPLHDATTFERSGDDPSHGLHFASRAESLAWKLLWLLTDIWPQAKDLYDAVLLAEDTEVPAHLLDAVGAESDGSWPNTLRSLRLADDSWPSFRAAHPSLAHFETAEALLERLQEVLRVRT